MSDSSDSESSVESFYEDLSEFEGEIEERRGDTITTPPSSTTHTQDDVDEGAYQDEPIASEEWIVEYNERQKEVKELELELIKRLSGEVPVSVWCKCGNCATRTLQNISECYCCTELDGCVESLTTDLVQQELHDSELGCVTEHPGFKPVCLEKWSLRMAADRFKTKSKQRYRQTGSEERYLRSIAYREFSRLIYGMLGNKRIPLPACAYIVIRDTFAITGTEQYAGFDMDEDSETH